MNRINYFVEQRLGALFGRFSSLPFVVALNKAFMVLLPLVMVGAFASLVAGISYQPWQELLVSLGVGRALETIISITLNLYGLWLAGALGYFYSRQLKVEDDALMLVFITMAALLMLTPLSSFEGQYYLGLSHLGSRGMVAAMIVAVAVVRIYRLCRKFKLVLKMPEGVPQAVEKSFGALIPTIIIANVIVIVGQVIEILGYSGISAIIYDLVNRPMAHLGSNPLSIIILMIMPNLLWFFGIHGAAAMAAIVPPLLMPLALENASAYAAGQPVPHMFAMGMINLIAVSYFSWVLVCLRSRKYRFRSLGKVALVPTIFNVSEPVNFGIPIVMNPYLLIPTILMPVVNILIMIVMMQTHLLPYTHSIYVWGVPIFLSGFIQSGIMGVVYQLIVVIIDYLIILPFFKAYETSLGEDGPLEEKIPPQLLN